MDLVAPPLQVLRAVQRDQQFPVSPEIDGPHEQAAGHEAFLERLERHPDIAGELVELSALLQARSTLGVHSVPGLEDSPLCPQAG